MESERALKLFKGAMPANPLYLPHPDPQSQANLLHLIKNRIFTIRNRTFSGQAKNYDVWAGNIASHFKTLHRIWPGYDFPEEVKIHKVAGYLDEQKREMWRDIGALPISDKGRLFTLREYLIYLHTS